MPRLNSTGSALMGIAGTPLSIDGSTPATFTGIPSGGWDWFTDTVIFGQADFGGGYQFYTYDTGTATLSASLGAADVNDTKAGGSVYAWFKAGTGVVTSIPTAYSLAGLSDVSPEGRTVIIQNSQADSGIQVYGPTGTLDLTLAAEVDTGGNITLRGTLLTYKDQVSGWHLVDISSGQAVAFTAQRADINAMIPVPLAGGKVALLERSVSERVTIRYKDAQLGYTLTSAAVYFLDAIEVTPGVVRVAWSTTTGEGPTHLQEIDITLTSGANSRGVVSGGAVVFTAMPVIPTTSLPGTPMAGGDGGGETGPLGALLEGIYRQPMVEMSRIVVRPWYLFFIQLIRSISQPTNLNNATGVLGPQQGGTGVTTGLTALNANNLTMGNIPIERFNNGTNASSTTFFRGDSPFGSWQSVGGGSGIGDVVGPASSVNGEIVLFDGVTGKLIKAATGTGVVFATDGVYSVTTVNSLGYWSPLTNGDPVTPELIFDGDGDTIAVWTAL